jgi:hypothetical protein
MSGPPPHPMKTRLQGEASDHDLEAELKNIKVDKDLAKQTVKALHIHSSLRPSSTSTPVQGSSRAGIIRRSSFPSTSTPIQQTGKVSYDPSPLVRSKRQLFPDSLSYSKFAPTPKRLSLDAFSAYRDPSRPSSHLAPVSEPFDYQDPFESSLKILRSPVKSSGPGEENKLEEEEEGDPFIGSLKIFRSPPKIETPTQEVHEEFDVDFSSFHISEPVDSVSVYQPQGRYGNPSQRKKKSIWKKILSQLTFSTERTSSELSQIYFDPEVFASHYSGQNPVFSQPSRHTLVQSILTPQGQIHFVTQPTSFPHHPHYTQTVAQIPRAIEFPTHTTKRVHFDPSFFTTSIPTATTSTATTSSSTHYSTYIPPTKPIVTMSMSVNYTVPGSQEIYDGTGNINTFLENFDNFTSVLGWNDSTKKAQLGFHLASAARTAYRLFTRTNPTSDYKTIVAFLRSNFKSKASTEEYVRRLRDRKYTSTDTPESYYFDVLYLVSKVNSTMAVGDIIRHLISGLPQRLGRDIAMKGLSKTEEVLEYLIRSAKYDSLMGKSFNLNDQEVNMIETAVVQSLAKLGIKTKKEEVNNLEEGQGQGNNRGKNYRGNYRGNNRGNFQNRGNNNNYRGRGNNNNRGNNNYRGNNSYRGNNNYRGNSGNNRGNYRGNYNNYRGYRGNWNNGYNHTYYGNQPQQYQPQQYQPQYQPQRSFTPQSHQFMPQRALTHLEAYPGASSASCISSASHLPYEFMGN